MMTGGRWLPIGPQPGGGNVSTRSDFHAALYDLAQAPEAEPALARMAALFERVLDLAAAGDQERAAELDDFRALQMLASALPGWQWPAMNCNNEGR